MSEPTGTFGSSEPCDHPLRENIIEPKEADDRAPRCACPRFVPVLEEGWKGRRGGAPSHKVGVLSRRAGFTFWKWGVLEAMESQPRRCHRAL